METNENQNLTAHAYILAGPDKEVLRAYAAQRIEEWQGPDPVHPDVVWLKREKAMVIPVAEVRERVVDDILIRPYRESYKIYVIEDAEFLGAAAQNALLKTLEEPPEYGILMLLTNRADALLDTVLSRAVLIPVGQTAGMGERQEEELLGMIRTLRHNRFLDNDRTVARILEMNKEGLAYTAVLEVMRKWFRDLLYVKENATNLLYYPQEKEYYNKDAAELAAQDIFVLFERIGEAEQRLAAGANAELVWKALFAQIRQGKDH